MTTTVSEATVLPEIVARRSVRSWTSQVVEADKLARCLEAVRLAPSAKNLQNLRVIVVRSAETRRALVEVAKGQRFVGEAPVVLAFCATNCSYVMTCGQPAYVIDAAIAADHLTLQATREGLGTCWIGAFFEDKAKALLHVPDDWRVVALMPLGYPNDTPKLKHRRPIAELVCDEHFA